MNSIDLEYFRAPLEWLDEDIGPTLTKLAVVCLHDQGHRSGVSVVVDQGKSKEEFQVIWTTVIDAARLGTLPNEQEVTQKGAECISLLLAGKLLGMNYFMTTQKGTRFDFWLSKSADELDFEARLEVSGIRKHSSQNNIKRRLDEKKSQISKSKSRTLDSYVSVVEFSKPTVAFHKL